VPVRVSAGNFRGFLHYVQENSRLVPQNKHVPLPSFPLQFIIHSHPIIRREILSELLTAVVNKLQEGSYGALGLNRSITEL
jgi:hypothetical protein